MKKVLTFAILIFASVLTFACKDGAKAQPNEPEQKEAKSGEVIVMNKDMFIKDVFDYEKSQDWKYKGDKPAIIDLYADWCGPCRMTAPIMKDLAKEYAGKIVIYKVNVGNGWHHAGLHPYRTPRRYGHLHSGSGR